MFGHGAILFKSNEREIYRGGSIKSFGEWYLNSKEGKERFELTWASWGGSCKFNLSHLQGMFSGSHHLGAHCHPDFLSVYSNISQHCQTHNSKSKRGALLLHHGGSQRKFGVRALKQKYQSNNRHKSDMYYQLTVLSHTCLPFWGSYQSWNDFLWHRHSPKITFSILSLISLVWRCRWTG